MIGRAVLHYRITEKLGEGGMGVVYKAHDTKLKREVAIKFLPHQIADSEEERERFKIEAQAAAALNHPNIATIYAIEEVDREMFIAMEYIEGRELCDIVGAHRDAPMPVDEIIDYATQIASGLQAAHKKGITHRDIKSSNIMITDEDQVKIMDFGLAKVRGGAQVTKLGTTLGTAAYMSPEQAQGLETDHRTDVWAFGVVLYEMLTGKVPFPGDYEQAVIYSILNEDPQPIASLRSDAPDSLEKVVNRTLTRDRGKRYQNMRDVLEGLKSDASIPTKPTSTQVHLSGKNTLLTGGISIALLLLLGIGYFFFKKEPADLKIVSTRPLTSAPGFEGQPTWSPDGTRIAYTSNENGRPDIWVRQINAGQSVNLTKDQSGNNTNPAWSPDGGRIAFFSDREEGGLFAIPTLGGSARRITAFSQPAYGFTPASWSPDASKLAFATEAIYTIAAEGGEKSRVPFQLTGQSLRDPAWSPDGERIAFVEGMGTGISTARLWTIRPNGTDANQLTDAKSFDNKPVWSADGKRILFVSDRGGSFDIWRLPVDENGKAGDAAKALTTGVGVGTIALSADGTKLAYEKNVQSSSIWSIPISPNDPLTIDDAKLILSENSLIESIALSPDAEWIAFDSNRGGNMDIWIMRPDGADITQITTDAAHDWWPTWSPDGKQIAFHSLRSGNRDIWIKPVAGGAAKQLTTHPGKDWLAFWSPTSDEIAFTSNRDGYSNVWVVSEGTAPRQVTFLKVTDLIGHSWAPNGKKLLFSSLQMDKDELYLASPNTRQIQQLTIGEFQQLDGRVWSADGNFIYAVDRIHPEKKGNIYAISVKDGSARKLTNFVNDPSKFLAVATSDGERLYFVFNEQKSDIWIAELSAEK